MAHGARSIRGAMGAYTWVATLLTAALALLLWLGPCHEPSPASVLLAPEGPWIEATLDDGTRLWELTPGQALLLAPGTYRVTLFAVDGQARRHDIIVGKEDILLGNEALVSPSGSPPPAR